MIAKRGLLRLLAVGAIAAAAWFTFHATVLPSVVVTPVRRGIAVNAVTGNVTVIPSMDGRVVAPAQGLLVKFSLKEGDRVKKGDTIAEIDQGEWPYQLNENRLELDRINQRIAQGSPNEIELDKLKKAYAKNQELAKAGNFPSDILERDRRDIERTEFALRLERSDLEYTKTKLENKVTEIQREIDRRKIKAGFDGVIMAPAVLQGEIVFAGTGICNITSLGKSIKATVNQDDLESARRAKRVLVTLFAHPGKVFEGKISQVLPFADGSQRFSLFIELPETPDTVLSGQTGESTFVADEHPESLLIPRKALVGSECFVVKNGRTERRKIKVGYTTLTDAEVLEGLREGDLVVSQDADLRRDNEKVTVSDAPEAK